MKDRLLTDGEIIKALRTEPSFDYKYDTGVMRASKAIAKAQRDLTRQEMVEYLIANNEAKSKVVLKMTGQPWQELVLSIDDKMYVLKEIE